MRRQKHGEVEPVDIVVLGPDYPDSFAENISSALADLALSAQLVDPAIRYAASGSMARFSTRTRYIDELNRRSAPVRRLLTDAPVERLLHELKPKLVVSVFGYFEPGQVERWRRATPGAVWALWYPDAVINIVRQQMFEAPYDHLFFKDHHLVHQFRERAGLSAHMLPQACNPARHRTEPFADQREEKRYSCDVAVLGNIYPHRALVLDAVPSSVDLRLYGNLYPNVARARPRLAEAFSGEYVTGRNKALAFRGAKIVLNTMHFAEIRGTNLRLFEATASGGFVLTHTIEGLGDYFEVGSEVAAFDTGSELADAVHHYLGDPEARRSIAEAGQKRSLRDHTYEVRFRRLFDICGLSGVLAPAPESDNS